jgi:hypothetical protein
LFRINEDIPLNFFIPYIFNRQIYYIYLHYRFNIMKNWKDTYDDVGSFKEERAWVKLNNKHGFVDTEGNEVVSLKYDDVGYFYEGRAGVGLNEKYGFVDTDGNEVIPLKYDWIGYFQEGRARVKSNGKWGFVDMEGNKVIPPKYDDVGYFSGGRAWVEVEINGEIIEGEIDLDGKQYFSKEDLPKLRKHRLPNIIDSIS